MSIGLFSALVLILMAEFAAALNTASAFAGTDVAYTIGTGVVEPEIIDLSTVSAAMVGIVVWSTIAWYYGFDGATPERAIEVMKWEEIYQALEDSVDRSKGVAHTIGNIVSTSA
jgi:hypothetical protein